MAIAFGGSPGSLAGLQANPDQKIIILTITDAEQVIVEALRVGARGFVLKSDAAQVAAVEALQRYRTFFTRRVGEMISNGFLRGEKRSDPTDVQLPRLTARERQVLHLVAEGKSTSRDSMHFDRKFHIVLRRFPLLDCGMWPRRVASNIRKRLSRERLPQTLHTSCGLLLMVSQPAQNTALKGTALKLPLVRVPAFISEPLNREIIT